VPNNAWVLLKRQKALQTLPKKRFEDGLPVLLKRKFEQVDASLAVPLGLREKEQFLTCVI